MSTATLPARAADVASKLRAERSLIEFGRQAWHVIEPQEPFIGGKHIDAMCDHLQALIDARNVCDECGEYNGCLPCDECNEPWTHCKHVKFCASCGYELDSTGINYLLWNQPPSTSKSMFASVFLAPYEWGPLNRPEMRYFFGSYPARDATWERDADRRRALIASDWYQARWGHRFEVTKDSTGEVRNDKGGDMFATSVGGGTGRHPDRRILDDLHSTQKGYESAADRRHTITWTDAVVGSRGIIRGSKVCCIAQRVHGQDVYQHLADKGNYVWVSLPMHFRPGMMKPTPLGWTDWRTELGELLWPEALPEEKVKELEQNIGPVLSPAQLEQNPRDPKSLIFSDEWARYFEIHGPHFRSVPMVEPDEFDQHVEPEERVTTGHKEVVVDSRQLKWFFTIDTAGTEEDLRNEAKGHDPSWSVCELWGYHPSAPRYMFLRAQWREMVAWLGLRKGVFDFLDRWSQNSPSGRRKKQAVTIEVNNHNLGGALAAELESRKGRSYKIRRVTPTKSKILRSTTLQSKMKAGQVFILLEPPPDHNAQKVRDGQYKDDWQSEVFSWTGGDDEQADQIDCSSMAAEEVGSGGGAWGGADVTGVLGNDARPKSGGRVSKRMGW